MFTKLIKCTFHRQQLQFLLIFLYTTTFHEFFQVLVSVKDRILLISLFQCSFLLIIVCPFVPYLLAVVFVLFAVSDYLLKLSSLPYVYCLSLIYVLKELLYILKHRQNDTSSSTHLSIFHSSSTPRKASTQYKIFQNKSEFAKKNLQVNR